MACRNICERYRATKDKASSYYAQGFKRCQMCELFINWGGAKCPCCKSALRTKPRGKKRINHVNHYLNTLPEDSESWQENRGSRTLQSG